MDLISTVTSLVVFGFGLLLLYGFFKYRSRKVEKFIPQGARLHDLVRWGIVNQLSVLKMGTLGLYQDEIKLFDSEGQEVYRFPLKDTKIDFFSTKGGFYLTYSGRQYNIRIDYGSIPAFFTISKRYEVWAHEIKSLGGRHFIDDQSVVSKAVFNPKSNRIYYIATLVIPVLLIIGGIVAGFVLAL